VLKARAGWAPSVSSSSVQLAGALDVVGGVDHDLACEEERVVGGRVEVGQRAALLDEGCVRGDEAEAEDVVGGVAGLVAGSDHGSATSAPPSGL
jgi:hypothetical protein